MAAPFDKNQKAPLPRDTQSPFGQIGTVPKLMVHVVLLAVVGIFILPLVWMILTGLKPEAQTMKMPPEWIPRTPTATLTRTFMTDEQGIRQTIADPKPERIPVVKMRQLEEPEYLVRVGEALGPKEKDLLKDQRMLAHQSDLKVGAKEWGVDLERGAGTFRWRIGEEIEKRSFQCDILESYAPGMWLVREYVPDTRQATKAGAGEQVTYAWGVVPENDIQERVQFMWQNIGVAVNKMNFFRMFLNTLWVGILGMIGTTLVSALVAYGFAFGHFPGKNALFAVTLATMMVPFPATMVPLFQLFRDLGWVGTFKPLWVPCWFGAAFNIFLLRQFFLGLPKDLLDAARIDGCGELEIFWHVVVPLSKPALAMVALFHFLHAWKDFMGPLLYLTDKSQFTLSLGLQAFQSQQGGTPWHLVMAASTIFSLPLIILFLMTMKTFIRGIAMTGIKG